MKSIRRTTCRLCDSSSLVLAVPMLPTPVGEGFVNESQRHVPGPLFPLDLHLCQNCGHLQLLEVLDAQSLFGDYLFTSSSSQGLIAHFRELADQLVSDCELGEGSAVLEIGSNDGTLLGFFQQRGLNVLGVDPARAIALDATARGIPTLASFFSQELATRLKGERGPFDLVVANNVFAHADGMRDIAQGIRTLLKQSGVFVFEVSYLVDTVDKMLFDTIYHEHLCYHSLAPLVTFLASSDLEIFHVERIASKGGSIRVFTQPRNGTHRLQSSVAKMLELERRVGADKLPYFQSYAQRIDAQRRRVVDEVSKLISSGVRLAGYGAAQTATTLLYQLQLEDCLEYIVDDNQAKQGLFCPGKRLPVLSSQALTDPSSRPDYVVILAWLYAEPIMRKNRDYLELGGKFVVPWPEFEVLDAASEKPRL